MGMAIFGPVTLSFKLVKLKFNIIYYDRPIGGIIERGLSVVCLDLTRERKGHRKPKFGRMEAHNTGNL